MISMLNKFIFAILVVQISAFDFKKGFYGKFGNWNHTVSNKNESDFDHHHEFKPSGGFNNFTSNGTITLVPSSYFHPSDHYHHHHHTSFNEKDVNPGHPSSSIDTSSAAKASRDAAASASASTSKIFKTTHVTSILPIYPNTSLEILDTTSIFFTTTISDSSLVNSSYTFGNSSYSSESYSSYELSSISTDYSSISSSLILPISSSSNFPHLSSSLTTSIISSSVSPISSSSSSSIAIASAVVTSSSSSSSTATTSTSTAVLSSSSTSKAATVASTSAVSKAVSSGSSDLQVISGGFSGTGETTRYWDCCLPSYSWPGKSTKVTNVVNACDASGNKFTNTDFQSGCNGGSAYMCNDQTPWAISDDLAYGFAAASIDGATDETLACSCYKLTFTSTAVSGKSLVVQITNTGGDLSGNHFDLALPGGGFGIFTSGCPGEFGSGYSWGEQYGGVSSESDCDNLPTVLQSGCDFRFDWFQGADNPDVSFEQVVCPAEIIAKSGCSRTDE